MIRNNEIDVIYNLVDDRCTASFQDDNKKEGHDMISYVCKYSDVDNQIRLLEKVFNKGIKFKQNHIETLASIQYRTSKNTNFNDVFKCFGI